MKRIFMIHSTNWIELNVAVFNGRDSGVTPKYTANIDINSEARMHERDIT